MHYIIVDFEWNQPEHPARRIRKPVCLYGEIIQIGAVKLDERLCQLDTFKIMVRPVFYRKMNRYVSQITGLTETDFDSALPFAEAISLFREWCGEAYCFLTWGSEDESVLRSNLILNKLDDQWLPRVYDAQVLFSRQIAGCARQYSLPNALEMLQETPLAVHDALLDALNTALVCRHLDLQVGLQTYDEQFFRACAKKEPPETEGYATTAAAMEADAVRNFACPACGRMLTCGSWVRKKHEIRMAIVDCPDCSRYFVKVRLRLRKDGRLKAARRISPLNGELMAEYEKAVQETERKRRYNARRSKRSVNRT